MSLNVAQTADLVAGLKVSQGIFDLGGSVTQTAAGIAQGRIESIQAGMQQRLARAQAADAIARGSAEAAQRVAQAKQEAGAQRAGYAAQGVNVGTGSAAATQASTGFLGALDAATIRANAYREALGFRMTEADYRVRRKMLRSATTQKAVTTAVTGGMRFAKDTLGDEDVRKYWGIEG